MNIKLQIADYENNLQEIQATEAQINQLVASHQERLTELKKKDEDMREAIKEAMKSEEIKKYESDILTLTYIAPSERTIIDSKRLKEENPDLWSEYSKTSQVKDSIRITIK